MCRHQTAVTAASWLRREAAFDAAASSQENSFAPAFVSGDSEGILLLWDARQRSATNIPGKRLLELALLLHRARLR